VATALRLPTTAASQPENEQATVRPVVSAVLQGGERVEGVLERFDDGVYWLLVGKERRTLAEKDLASIRFHAASGGPTLSDEDQELEELIRQFFALHRGEKRLERGGHPALIPLLAAAGPRAVRPLLAAFQKHDDDYQAAGEVLKQIGPEAFGVMVECVREYPGRSARFPVWWALCESGTKHAAFVQGLLKDKDPRIRLLGMEVLYSWATSSGIALPKNLDVAVIQILDDPDNDVRSRAPSILGRIGFNSELAFPMLLRTLEDDSYASIRSKSVIALGHLGRDLKATDPDLARLVAALARSVTHDPNFLVRGSAAYYLGELGPKAAAATSTLRQASGDKKESVREKAEEALAKVEGREQPRRKSKKGRD
jgi:hypothetical protein